MAIKYPENISYKSGDTLHKKVLEVASLVPRPKPKTDISKYQNISAAQNNIRIPSSVSSLGSITTPFGGSTKFEKFHPGLDIANKAGTPIPSFSSGTVTKTGTDKVYGNYVELMDNIGNTQKYSHLLKAYVTPGQKINKGSTIGAMGATGNVYSLSGGSGSHLDLRIRDAYNKYINPMSYFQNTKLV